MRLPRQILVAVRRRLDNLIGRSAKRSPIAYWEDRARRYGERSVLNIGHSDAEVAAQTRLQKETLFPLFRERLAGGESVLDLGCGPGRFTAGLAELTSGRVIGADPIQHLLDIAPPADRVEYRRMREGEIPGADGEFAAIWVCLVLGGIMDDAVLRQTLAEIDRVLAPGGLLFLVENTAAEADTDHWRFRSEQAYRDLVPFVPLEPIASYDDLGQRISVLSGRRDG